MKFFIKYSRFGIDLDVSKEASKDEMITTFLRTYGGPEDVLDHFLRYASFMEDTIPDATIIEETESIENKENRDE